MAYQVKLNQFEGPLDLLLHLIEEAQVDIKDIFISEITNQYLAYMEALDELDMETASEFLSVAATLVYIKSRSLLPKPPKEEEPNMEDPEEVLLRQLREYKAFKEISCKLNSLYESASRSYSKLPEELVLPEQEVTLKEMTTSALYAVFTRLMADAGEERVDVREIEQDRFTIRSQLRRIRSVLQERETVRFEELFEGIPVKLEMIVTFMALLDMIRRSEIKLKQSTPYGAIMISAAKLMEDDEDFEYMDEGQDGAK